MFIGIKEGTCGHLISFLEHLKKSPHKAAYVLLTKDLRGLLVPMSNKDRDILEGCGDGFTCYAIQSHPIIPPPNIPPPVIPPPDHHISPTYTHTHTTPIDNNHPQPSYDMTTPMDTSISNDNTNTNNINTDSLSMTMNLVTDTGVLSGKKRGREQETAAAHYNSLTRKEGERHLSQIFHLRCLNNWIKRSLIESTATSMLRTHRNLTPQQQQHHKGLCVLELACGKGGDIQKWLSCPGGLRAYLGVDIAKGSLEDFVGRLKDLRDNNSNKASYLLACADLGVDSLLHSPLPCYDLNIHGRGWVTDVPVPYFKKTPPPSSTTIATASGTAAAGTAASGTAAAGTFDVISCQFALHYMFQTRSTADFFFEQVSTLLRPGGLFIATTVDCRVVADLAMRAMDDEDKDGDGLLGLRREIVIRRNSTKSTDITTGNGNGVRKARGSLLMRMRFDQSSWDCLRPQPVPMSCSDSDDKETHFDKNNDDDDDDTDGDKEEAKDGDRKNNDDQLEPYGLQYNFALFDNSGDDENDGAAVDAPEWLVFQGPGLDALAARHNLKVSRRTNFHEFFEMELNGPDAARRRESLEKSTVFDVTGCIPEEEWQIARR
eukprot:gene4370-8698_t